LIFRLDIQSRFRIGCEYGKSNLNPQRKDKSRIAKAVIHYQRGGLHFERQRKKYSPILGTRTIKKFSRLADKANHP
jgi:hypothetical protein